MPNHISNHARLLLRLPIEYPILLVSIWYILNVRKVYKLYKERGGEKNYYPRNRGRKKIIYNLKK